MINLTDDPNDIRNWLDELEAESWNDWNGSIDDDVVFANIEKAKEFCANYNMNIPEMEEYIFKKGPSLGIPFEQFIKYAKKNFFYDCTFHLGKNSFTSALVGFIRKLNLDCLLTPPPPLL